MYLEGVLLGIQDGEKLRRELNTILDNKTYGKLYYHTRVFENTRSIAVSSVITPPFFYDNNSFNNHDNPSISYSNIMLTIFPSEKYANVILACSKQDKLGIKFLKKLRVLSKLKFQKAVSSIIVGNVGNTFLSPIFWNALGEKKQDILLKELSFCIMEIFHPFMSHQSFFHSKINFFDPIYSASNL